MSEKYIQIGVTALRGPATGDFLPSVPLYIKADKEAEEAEQRMFNDIGKDLARMMRKYNEACAEAMNKGS